MNKRNYNIFFHLHTVSGITISVFLFIIFFAGAFALIKGDIAVWEKGEPVTVNNPRNIDYDRAIRTIQQKGYTLAGRDVRILMPDERNEMLVVLSASKYEKASKQDKTGAYFYLNTVTFKITDYYAFYSFGELIYRFHFLTPIPFGLYIAGFVALFFLFAIVTGVIVHWDKIISNFYIFRPTSKLKTIWTDAHTALGMIGLPFQFVYALTSCFLCLSILVLIPANYLYHSNQAKLLEELRPMTKSSPLLHKSEKVTSFNTFIKQNSDRCKSFEPLQVYIKNYGDRSMKYQVDGALAPDKRLLGYGRLVYDVHSGQIISSVNPNNTNYLENVELAIRKLHFGDYGGYWLKFAYFVMAIITCFVIISGVLIWLEARNKKSIPEYKRRFNRRVSNIYLSICLTMYPITAISFIVSKLIPRDMDVMRQPILYSVFFVGWIVMALLFGLKKNNYFTNKYTLLIAAIVGLLIPIVNGLSSGNWIWKTLPHHQTSIFVIDTFWLIASVVTFFAFSLLAKRKEPKG
ncbi:putative iron-regulated membrane protein [Arcticibacter svalbardensis MN12-7]|uniref:Putative iron-regulated membrane protein n=1 Tax=Arcticibacter svalbardensis MN12-7 TaxID=1150600 RepID=R9GU53_9SPHI|nr:PepSY-associated TM helix domain-containing protein [Arcticibacter svalbardensis]EOR95188.1 putative iron-regulated membrane protein [Arcticibacter svalbardensis MN12-7]